MGNATTFLKDPLPRQIHIKIKGRPSIFNYIKLHCVCHTRTVYLLEGKGEAWEELQPKVNVFLI